jgi:hypothetical protein
MTQRRAARVLAISGRVSIAYYRPTISDSMRCTTFVELFNSICLR